MDDLSYTNEDITTAAAFMRSQAPRLPHAQRRAALMFCKIMAGVEIGMVPLENPIAGITEVGGVYVSIPVNIHGELIGSVDFSINPPEVDGGTPQVIPHAENFFRWSFKDCYFEQDDEEE